ncbi:alpha/beta-hydrolase [Calocera viscosa TUFC12733]|uniref:Alpha/beta-hydrolase n=1 Tax=Calocera viscosa (strain TUFC12733) TaxID=1330018 RepID=A0A167LDE6_CALVF|nr:alpha/beta-hydrolase [Calocera viscosa TUFC12733]
MAHLSPHPNPNRLPAYTSGAPLTRVRSPEAPLQNPLGANAVTTQVPSGAQLFALYLPAEIPDEARSDVRPLLVLLHGYPQNHKMWYSFARHLRDWDLLIPDLPGYGHSKKDPSPDGSSTAHSKREMAKDLVHLIYSLHPACAEGGKVIVYGHDRGARLAYRMALDFPDLVVGLGVLDIVPTAHAWESMSLSNQQHAATRRSYHWLFLAAPYPIPETLIDGRPTAYMQLTMGSWMGKTEREREGGGLTQRWVADSIQPYCGPGGMRAIRGACEDYRAGATHDLTADLPLLQHTQSLSSLPPGAPRPPAPFQIPILALSSLHLHRSMDVAGIWSKLGEEGKVRHVSVGDEGTGHFLVNEQEEECVRVTREWLARWWP